MADDGESLESRLNKATNPSNRQEDWEFIMGFCDQVNKELEGPQISVKLLVHKIQSPQEWEAIQALTVLEACMKNCGKRFHSEVGKFRFLNELIKVISPKYEGDAVSEKMKAKVITMMYSWTVSLPHEAKICEAYHLLKSQGIVLADPEIPRDATLTAPPSPRPKNPVFDDEKKSKRLADLLKSKKAEDLQEANWLIKNMVKEDKVRTQKAEKQRSTLEAVNNSVKVLGEMLEHFSSEESTDGDKELIMELYGDCDKLRQTVFQLATETEDNDNSLGDILQASDDLFHVINLYKRIVETIKGQREKAQQSQSSGTSCTKQSEMLIDLLDMDIKSTSESRPRSLTTSSSPPADIMWGPTASDPRPPNPSASSAALCLLDEELLSLGLSETVPGTGKPTRVNLSECLPSSQASSQDLALFDITSSSVPVCCSPPLLSDVLSASTVSLNRSSSTGAMFSTALVCKKSDWAGLALSSVLTTTVPAASPAPPTPVHTSPQPSYTTLSSQNLQDFTLLELSSPTITPQQKTEQDLFTPAPLSFSHCASSNKPTSLLLRGMPGVSTSPPVNSQTDNSLPLHPPSSLLHLSCSTPGWEQQASLANVFVPLDAVRPSHECLVTAYDKNGIRVVLHFATDCPGGRADILVMVASIRSTAPLPVRNVVLQAAVPKTMKVRLQQPSGTELAPFNPVLPPASITQVILLANPLKEKVRMRYKLTFTLGEQWYTEVGEVNEFPPVHTRGAL